MNTDTIRELTQSVIAVSVVVGGGVIMYLQPASPAMPFITAMVGMVAAFYFSRSQAQAVADKTAAALKP